MTSLKGACCRECVFWEPIQVEGPTTGECRRHAPKSHTPIMAPYRPVDEEDPDGDQYETQAEWPRTWETDWCGEFVREPSVPEGVE